MPRFVILEHHYEGVHWDFMLEAGESLRTWRLATPPAAHCDIAATPLADHRRVYLEYEGEVSGGRGFVTRWDDGEFDWLENRPESVELRLHGRRTSGRAYLFKGASDDWTFRLTSDEPESAEGSARPTAGC